MDEPETVVAKQRAKRNGTLGVLGTALGTALSAIVYLVQMQHAEAEKRELAGRAASMTIDAESIDRKLDMMRHEISDLRQDLVAVRERMARAETRLDERRR